MASTIDQPASERRQYKMGGCEYLLNDEARTAWIVKGPRIGRRTRYRIPDSVVVDGEKYTVESVEIGAFRKAKCLKHVVIPDSVEFVDEFNFSSLPSLRSIFVGKRLDYLTSWIFQCNKKLSSFVIDKENPNICVDKGIIYSKCGKCALTTPYAPRHLHIKEGVEVIEKVAFWYNENLESVTFPSTLKKIGDNSFGGCPKLKEVKLPEGFEECVVQCFMEDEGLEMVDLPSTMKELNHETFYGCHNLRTLIIRTKSVLVTDRDSKFPLDIPARCTLKVPKDLIEEYRNSPYWNHIERIESI